MELSVLKGIVIILALSTFVNLIFTKIKVPTVIGYLVTGLIAGPHLLGLIGAQHEIELMAEIGIILLLFSIGIEFSLEHLLKIRRIVFLGGLIQVTITALAFFFISFFYEINWKSGLFVGFMAALSSSAIVLKLLQERSELTSNYGRTVLGILIFQDLMLVPLLLLSNFLTSDATNFTREISLLLLKSVAIVAFVYVGNRWVFPRLLKYITMVKNQELFMMSIFLICLSVALMTYEMGMGLAFGAFLAGLMVSESEYSHNAFGSLIPFKDAFTSFFFVSIGMLLDINFVIENLDLVLITVVLILVVKTVVAGATGFALGHTFKGTVMVGLALSQVGEFSFILAKIGLDKEIIHPFFYQLFLAVAIITMSISPFILKLGMPLSNLIMKLPLPKFLINGISPLPEIEIPELKNHLVIIGKDSSSHSLSSLAKHVKLPYIAIVFDPELAHERQKKGETVIYGDAVNEPILKKAHIDTADIVVISIGNIMPAMAIIEKVRDMNKHVHILVRAKSINDIEQLYELGANQVFPENFEIAIDLFERILLKRLMPQQDINSLLANIRTDYFGIFMDNDGKNRTSILDEIPNIDIVAVEIDETSCFAGKTLQEINLRNKLGVTLVAIKRKNEIIEHPMASDELFPSDVLYLLGTFEQTASALNYLETGQEQQLNLSIT